MSAEAVSSPGFPPASILVVDDDETMRDLLRRMLERTGLTVVLAVNGRDALERLRDRPADLVVTDMVMPEMDGIELIRLLATERPRLPIVAISGVHDWANYLRMAIRLGAKAGVQKPVSAAELVATVRGLLAARQENARRTAAK
ncbi:MAG TPA: response regulator [Stellaceae bacterium]